jgi:hypothetical protein
MPMAPHTSDDPPVLTELGVLVHVRKGNTARVACPQEHRRAFLDRDGRLALEGLRHALGARPAETRALFPFTAGFLQAVLRRLGHNVGLKRCYEMVHRLADAEAISPEASYREAYRDRPGGGTHLVVLWTAPTLQARVVAPGKNPLSVGTDRAVKRESAPWAWCRYGLFADYEGLPPPHLPPPQAKRLRRWQEKWGA